MKEGVGVVGDLEGERGKVGGREGVDERVDKAMGEGGKDGGEGRRDDEG